MRSLFDYLSVMLIIIFWIFRIIVCACYTIGKDIGVAPIDFNIELVILFATLLFVILIMRRKLIGAVALLLAHGYYYGGYVYQGIMDNTLLERENVLGLLFAIYGLIIPLLALFSVLVTKIEKRDDAKDKKTDWFFLNKKFDREHDERADENQYKF